jgi:hypothetical protein
MYALNICEHINILNKDFKLDNICFVMFKIIIFTIIIIIISQFVEMLNEKVSNTWILRTKMDVNQVSSLLVDNNFKLIQSVKLDNMENYIVEADYSKINNENELNELEHRIKSNSMTILFEREKILKRVKRNIPNYDL